jgi:DNA-binding NarL/FixJ family response regulator
MRESQALVMLEIAYNLAENTHDAMRRIARAAMSVAPRGPVTVACFDSCGQLDPGSVRFERASKDYEIAQHLAIAWRLRTALGGADRCSAPSVGPRTAATTARDVLRCAVVAHERSRAGSPVAGSQSLWQAIVAGHWSLLDAFTAAETRYIVASKNPAGGGTLRALAQRECSVLEPTLGGHSGKWISLELKLCESTVARVLRTALRRIGVTDTADLVGVRNAVFEPIDGVVAGVELAVARLTPGAAAPCLTDAERAIVMGLVGGKRAAAIARERGTTPRTVSNQLTSVYRKLGVCSRREVLALFL